MSEQELTVTGGVSWLNAKLNTMLEDRKDFLAHGIAQGVPTEEYQQMVGRYRETKRMIGEISELFIEFQQADDDDGDELGELDDD